MSAHIPDMRPTRSRWGLLACLILTTLAGGIALGTWVLFPRAKAAAVEPMPPSHATALAQDVPAAFVPNLGQWNHPAQYVARFGSASVFLEHDGLWLSMAEQTARSPAPREPWRRLESLAEPMPVRGTALGLRLVGADPAKLVPEDVLPGKHNYFLGNDALRWRTDVPRYAAVRYRGTYPGIELRMYSKDGHLEYDLELSPGADLAQVEIEVEGAEQLRIDTDGALLFDTVLGPVRQPPAQTWEAGPNGVRRTLMCEYELRGPRRFGFAVPAWSRGNALVVDPGLIWSTLVGGTVDDSATGFSVDAAGIVTLAGGTASADYPTTPGAWSTTSTVRGDVVVTRLDPSMPAAQQLLYSTFIGGSAAEFAAAIAVDAAGVVTICGTAQSTDYPTTPNAWSQTFNGMFEGFVTRLDPSLPAAQQLVYSTSLGGGGVSTWADALLVDAAGVVTVTGNTSSPTYPTTPSAWDTTHNGLTDIFVTRLDPGLPSAQQLVYSTFLGGNDHEGSEALSVAPSGLITVVGGRLSLDYPLTPSVVFGGFGVITQLDPSLPAAQQLVYSAGLGSWRNDAVMAVWVDAAGVLTVAGYTTGPGLWTTTNAYSPLYLGGIGLSAGDGFVTQIDPSLPPLQQILYSTYLGSSDVDAAIRVVVDASGVITVAGETQSAGFPTTPGAWDRFLDTPTDAFVTRLDPRLSGAQQLVYSTLLGGNKDDRVVGLAVDAASVATIGGNTKSTDFPTTSGAWGTVHNGGEDVFLTRLELLPNGVRTYGTSSPGCQGTLSIGVPTNPIVGNPGFGLACTNAPPSALGALILGSAQRTAPIVVLGAGLWIDPYGAFYGAFAATSAPDRSAFLPMPIPINPWLAGQSFHAQWFWVGPSSPPPCPPFGISGSNAVEVTFQP